MNKTVSANIGGMVFHIEEHAYEKLNKYLGNIRSHFTKSDGQDEIIQDIESRIAEIFQDRNKSKEVILEADIDHVISVMGKPEQLFGDDENAQAKSASSFLDDSTPKAYKRLYRDPEDRVIAGVCSGLSHRLNIDPVWFRLAFVLIFFLAGSGILVYIILALVLPKAETPAQKLEMRGEQVNINTLSKEASAPASTKPQGFISRFFDVVGSVFLVLLKAIAYIAGAFVAFIGLVILFAIVVTILAMMGLGGISIPVYITDYFLTSSQQFWSIVAIILVFGVPTIMLIYGLVKMVFKLKHSNRMLNMSALVLWIAGVAIGFIVGVNVAKDYSHEEKIRTNIPLLKPEADTLYLKLMENDNIDDDKGATITIFGKNNDSYITGDDFYIDGDNVDFDVQRAAGNNFELVQIASAHGPTRKDALSNAEKITYNLEQRDSVIMFSEYMPVKKGDKFHGQEVKLVLRIPVGKQIFIDEGMESIFYDLKNVTDTWDGNMGGHYWMMTEAGLKCTDYDFENDPDANVGGRSRIRTRPIHSNDENVDIKIDHNGIQINGVDDTTKEKIENGDYKIKINKEGIHIKTDKIDEKHLVK